MQGIVWVNLVWQWRYPTDKTFFLYIYWDTLYNVSHLSSCMLPSPSHLLPLYSFTSTTRYYVPSNHPCSSIFLFIFYFFFPKGYFVLPHFRILLLLLVVFCMSSSSCCFLFFFFFFFFSFFSDNVVFYFFPSPSPSCYLFFFFIYLLSFDCIICFQIVWLLVCIIVVVSFELWIDTITICIVK